RMFKGRRDPRQEEIAAAAFCIRASLLAFAITACFSSVAYQSALLGLAGLSAAFIRSVQTDVELLCGAQVAQAPRPARQTSRILAPVLARPARVQPQAKRY